ncbi:MAG: 50S ribosomal protein L15 [Rhodospirillales bacterium]|nr:50S ribosomal protein L15 [Rhodospirillales bacterium]
MRLNELRDRPGARIARTRLGRGMGSGKGKTSGRGHKGQKARTGSAVAGFEGGQMPLHRRLPKRGFNNIFRREIVGINLGMLQKAIEDGRLKVAGPITETMLAEAGLVRKRNDGVKLLAKGAITSALTIEVSRVSKAAQDMVEKAGGKVIVPAPKPVVETKGTKRWAAWKKEQQVDRAKALETALADMAKGPIKPAGAKGKAARLEKAEARIKAESAPARTGGDAGGKSSPAAQRGNKAEGKGKSGSGGD